MNVSYILIIVFSAPDQEEDEQAEDEDDEPEEDARYGAHHHVARAGVSGLVRGAVALGVTFVPVTPICSTTLKRMDNVNNNLTPSKPTTTLLSGSLYFCAILCASASLYLGSTHWMVFRADWW